MNSLYKFIQFSVKHGNCGGNLVQFQQGSEPLNALPFDIRKVLVMSDIKLDDCRGGHAHYETEEILLALQGGCTVDLDDGKEGHASVRLQAQSETQDVQSALLLYPHIWRTLKDFESNTILLVVANMKYNETDYIRDRTKFLEETLTWSGLGGSSEY